MEFGRMVRIAGRLQAKHFTTTLILVAEVEYAYNIIDGCILKKFGYNFSLWQSSDAKKSISCKYVRCNSRGKGATLVVKVVI